MVVIVAIVVVVEIVIDVVTAKESEISGYCIIYQEQQVMISLEKQGGACRLG